MGNATTLWSQNLQLTSRFRVEIRVYEVEPSKKYPDCIKARFALVDTERNIARYVVDNHAPYGFHAHTALPEDKTIRVTLNVDNYFKAFDEFLSEAERIVENEE